MASTTTTIATNSAVAVSAAFTTTRIFDPPPIPDRIARFDSRASVV
jgi:multisubunit Na+/H+ antiporter MnhF subunit